MVDIAPAVCEFVFALTADVPAEIAAAREVEAVFTFDAVFVLTKATIELEAFERRLAVLPFTAVVPEAIAAASDVDAVVTSDCSAKAPDERPAPVRVRVPNDQTCDAVKAFALVAT